MHSHSWAILLLAFTCHGRSAKTFAEGTGERLGALNLQKYDQIVRAISKQAPGESDSLAGLLLALQPQIRFPQHSAMSFSAPPTPRFHHVASMNDAPTSDTKRCLAAGAVGFSAGLLGGALGLGGGFLAVPALTSLLKLDPKLAIGTSSFVNLMVSSAACRSYLTRGLASPRAAAIIASSALLLARVGATMTSKINSKRLKKVFGSYLVVASLLVAAKTFGLLVASSTASGAAAEASFLGLACLGSATGFLSGLLGVGGGTILVPALTLGFGIPQLEAQGSSLLGMIPSSMVSSLTHLQKGNLDKQLVKYVAVGALLGALGGGNLAAVLPLKFVRILFSVVLGGIGLKYATS